jgi:UDP-N-acetylmuramoyl-tripeptide--D-alanyl-D-alanine ligase
VGDPMTVLWDSTVVDDITGGHSSAPWVCSGVSIDTRTLGEGDLFVALKGDAGDGHTFLPEAASKGAAAGLVSEESEATLPLLQVKDPLQALEKLGIAARKRSSAIRLAVTGSVGKTSTKDMLRWVFKDQGHTHGSVSSYNNHWGVPLTLARMPQTTQFSVFEVGMNHAGEIRPLTQMIRPHIALVTSVVEAHVEFFKSVEDIARAKAEIFEGMEAGGRALLNHDSPHFDLLSKIAKERALEVVSFGTDPRSTFRLLSYEGQSERSYVSAEIGGENVSYMLPAPGTHWALNSLSVLGAVHLAGADVKAAAHSLATIEIPAGRGRRYKGSFTVLDESYNANPASMRAAFEVLGKSEEKRKIAVIGDMREMGDTARRFHEELLEPLLENKIDLVYCCGPYMAHLFERLPKAMKGGYALTSMELLPLVVEATEPGDVITVKASLGTRVKPIVEALLERQKE